MKDNDKITDLLDQGFTHDQVIEILYGSNESKNIKSKYNCDHHNTIWKSGLEQDKVDRSKKLIGLYVLFISSIILFSFLSMVFYSQHIVYPTYQNEIMGIIESMDLNIENAKETSTGSWKKNVKKDINDYKKVDNNYFLFRFFFTKEQKDFRDHIIEYVDVVEKWSESL